MDNTNATTEHTGSSTLSRRTFLKKSTLVPLIGLAGAVEIKPEPLPKRVETRLEAWDTVNCALVGFGTWGRELAATLARLPEANLVAVCDNYDVMLRRAQRDVPQASTHTDYREVLDNPDVQAVFIATPTHRHRTLAIEALAAGKNVYCEAPMASTLDDAKAIAQAAREASNQIFQVGQIYRTNPQHRSVFQFIRSGAVGKPTMARAQWHTKQSWRRTSPNRQRERDLNWRLDAEVSTGLMGEVALHQLDVAFWILGSLPTAVTGFGQTMLWNDGRQVPDTIQAIFEFPKGVHLLYDATLTSSFDDAYELFFGNDSTIIFRERGKAWMFKEVDAPMLGWEVYARKDKFYKETGIALLANATQLDAQNQDPTEDDPNAETPLWYALKDFMDNHTFGPYLPAADYQRGYEAAVVAIKANEAITQNTKLAFDQAWFSLD